MEILQYASIAVIIKKGIFHRFAVIITIAIVWVYAHILTVAGAYRHRPPETQYSCRTDRAGLIYGSPWYYFLSQLVFQLLLDEVELHFIAYIQCFFEVGLNPMHFLFVAFVLLIIVLCMKLYR